MSAAPAGREGGTVLRLDQCTPDLLGRVGGKAVGLGHLHRQSLEVPAAFVITTDAYRDWTARRSLLPEVSRLLERSRRAILPTLIWGLRVKHLNRFGLDLMARCRGGARSHA